MTDKVKGRLAALADVALPVETLREAAPHLRRPFTPEAVKFKVQTVFKEATGCIVVAYIDARLVVERLNAVLPDKWVATYQMFDETKLMWCHLTVDGTVHSDVGESPKGKSKDLVSDSLKRAAVHFGIGVSVYALPQITLWMKDSRGRIESRPSRNGPTIVLTEKGHEALRGGYRKWLDEHGEGLFGPALDHGDVEGQVVDPDVEVEGEFVPAPPDPLTDERATTAVELAKALYREIAEIPGGTQQIPSGKFNAWLKGAEHDHGELDRLVAYLEQRKGEIAAEFAGAES